MRFWWHFKTNGFVSARRVFDGRIVGGLGDTLHAEWSMKHGHGDGALPALERQCWHHIDHPDVTINYVLTGRESWVVEILCNFLHVNSFPSRISWKAIKQGNKYDSHVLSRTSYHLVKLLFIRKMNISENQLLSIERHPQFEIICKV